MNNPIQRMIADIESEVLYTRAMIGRSALDARVMQALARVPRDEFVPSELRYRAFDNGPLPIGHGQTISQPYIVALMSDLLRTAPDHRVLEIGTGSGYQTAVLSLLCARVYSMEVVNKLSDEADRRLRRLGYHNIETTARSGYGGWVEHAPYDGIIVTAASTHIPPALIEQLKPGCRMVIPVGQPHGYQNLVLVEKDQHGGVHSETVLGVAFVPLVEA